MYLFEEVVLEKCEDCKVDMIECDFTSVCPACGLINTDYQVVGHLKKNIVAAPRYKPNKHFETVLNRLQGSWSRVCSRFSVDYIDRLKEKLGDDYSLPNIHKHLPNRDQRYLNYIHGELTGDRLTIDVHDKEFLEIGFNRCYKEYLKFGGKRPCALNILKVIIERSPRFDYIKPYIYTKFKLDNSIYNRLKHVCSN